MPKFPKGSKQAKDHMSYLRSLRGKGCTSSLPVAPEPASVSSIFYI